MRRSFLDMAIVDVGFGPAYDVGVEHSAAAARALANGRLAVLPGTHLLPLESPDLLNPVIAAFLRDTLPPKQEDAGP